MRATRAAPALVVLALAGCDALDPMISQQKYKAYRASELYPDGLSMRDPPAGTVPRERTPAAPVATGRTLGGALVTKIPVPVTKELLAVGRKRFEIVCGACHGLLGDGRSLVARNMSLRPPPSLHQRTGHPDGYYYEVISQGFGLMPSYAAEIPPEERWAIVAYVRALQLSQHATLDQAPPEVRSRLEKEPR